MKAHNSNRRRGIIIVGVLVVIVVLSLAAYQFVDSMTSEARTNFRVVRSIQSRSLADSGLNFAMAVLSDPDTLSSRFGGNPFASDEFKGKSVFTGENDLGAGKFTLISLGDGSEMIGNELQTRYGVTDESGKINLNALIRLDSRGRVLHDVLMKLPNMTEDVAYAIVDWMDTNEDVSTNGAESQEYAARTPPYRCKNGELDSLEELLLVRGVTPRLLFGTDRNRNGRLDPDEGGTFDAGWSQFLTVYSREPNTDKEGNPRIRLRASDTASIQTMKTNLEGALGAELMNFLAAYLIWGGSTISTPRPGDKPIEYTDLGELSGLVGAALGDGKTRPRGRLSSIYDLINAQVTVPSSERDKPAKVFRSPLADPAKRTQYLPILFDKTTTSNPTREIPARVNVNTAPRQVLEALPGMTTDIVDKIIAARPALTTFNLTDPAYESPAWLLTSAGLDPAKLKSLERYITTRTQVFRTQALGYYEKGGGVTRLEAVIDTNQGKPRIVYWRDLSELGKGFELP